MLEPKHHLLKLATLFYLYAQVYSLIINDITQGVTQCHNVQLSWSGGVPPYAISIIDPNKGTVLVSLGQTDSESFIGVVTVPSGATVNFRVTDSIDTTALSNVVTVESDDDDNCCGCTVQSLPQSTAVLTSSTPPPLVPGTTSTTSVFSTSIASPSSSSATTSTTSSSSATTSATSSSATTSTTSSAPTSSPLPAPTASNAATNNAASSSTLSAQERSHNAFIFRVLVAVLVSVMVLISIILFLVMLRRSRARASRDKFDAVERQGTTDARVILQRSQQALVDPMRRSPSSPVDPFFPIRSPTMEREFPNLQGLMAPSSIRSEKVSPSGSGTGMFLDTTSVRNGATHKHHRSSITPTLVALSIPGVETPSR